LDYCTATRIKNSTTKRAMNEIYKRSTYKTVYAVKSIGKHWGFFAFSRKIVVTPSG
jgi:hypothetical protein